MDKPQSSVQNEDWRSQFYWQTGRHNRNIRLLYFISGVSSLKQLLFLPENLTNQAWMD